MVSGAHLDPLLVASSLGVRFAHFEPLGKRSRQQDLRVSANVEEPAGQSIPEVPGLRREHQGVYMSIFSFLNCSSRHGLLTPCVLSILLIAAADWPREDLTMVRMSILAW